MMGRPKGSRTVERVVAVVQPSVCPACGSSDREPYNRPLTVVECAGEYNGRPYTRVVFRVTRCRACGQHRYDKSYE